jgi:hypothetical protein
MIDASKGVDRALTVQDDRNVQESVQNSFRVINFLAQGLCTAIWNDAVGLNVISEYPSNFRKENNLKVSIRERMEEVLFKVRK